MLASLLTCCHNDPERVLKQKGLTDERSRDPTVSGIIVNKGPFQKDIVLIGKTVASRKTGISSSLSGKVSDIFFSEGDLVYESDTLVKLENEQHSVLLRRAENELDLAAIELNSLLLGYGGREDDSASVPPQIFRNIMLRSGYVEALENFRLAKYTIDRLTLTAPFTGMVSELDITEGQCVSAGEQLFLLTVTAPLKVVFHASPYNVQRIFIGQAFSLEVPGTVDGDSCQGVVTSIGPSTNEDGFPRVNGVLVSHCKGLFDGSLVKISLLTVQHDQLVVPKEALTLRDGRTIVFRYNQGRAVWTEVQVSDQNRDQYLISEGIKSGDTVLIEGNIELTHDIPVNLVRLTSKR